LARTLGSTNCICVPALPTCKAARLARDPILALSAIFCSVNIVIAFGVGRDRLTWRDGNHVSDRRDESVLWELYDVVRSTAGDSGFGFPRLTIDIDVVGYAGA
jgi:hypothetical protein